MKYAVLIAAEPLQRIALRVPDGRDGDLPLEWTRTG